VASIRERRRQDGTVGYAVLWRHQGKQTSLTFDTADLAERARRLVEGTDADPDRVIEVLTGPGGRGPTVADAVRTHVDELTGVLDQTRAVYRRMATDYILPTLGAIPVAAVDRAAVATWVNRLDTTLTKAGKPLSDKTIRNLHGLLSAVFTSAAERGWREGNPCRGIRLPRRDHDREEMVFLTRAEWSLLLTEIPEHWQPLFTTLAGTGIRWGEAAGLLVRHVDLLASPPVLRILQADRRTPVGRQLGPPKTRKSRRTITLPPQVVDVLVPLVAGRGPEERLFTTINDLPLHSGLYGRIWQPAIRRAQDPARHGPAALTKSPRVHDLRHSHAAWLVAEGVDVYAVARRLGHESITTTMDVYGHLLPDQERWAAEAAARALTAPTA
jgi:integrase